MTKILVTGMSGTGKSSALAELGRRGYRVVDTDDPGWREYRTYAEPVDEPHRGEYVWAEDRMNALLDAEDDRPLFVAGGVRNQAKFYDRFDAVVLLAAPADVILERVTRRSTNAYGNTERERAEILADLAEVEPVIRQHCTHELDASRPLADTVADLIAIASREA
jgi:dephospho-CoA kinase